MILYDKIDIKTLDFEFKNRNFKKDLLKEVSNYIKIFQSKKLHDADLYEIIGNTIDYDLIETNDYSGLCFFNEKIIALNTDKETVIPTLIHESVHAIQANVGIFDFTDNILSDMVKVEQQCESISYLIYNKLFNINRPDLFNTYFSKEDIQWLGNYYEGYVQIDIK